MAITNPFPSWGDTGESPASGFQYDGGDQVNEKHIDYQWDQLNKFADDVVNHALQDDGSVNINDGATAIPFTADAGADETLFDMSVSGTPAVGTEESVVGKIDGTVFMEWYAEADGAGGIQNGRVELPNHDLRLGTGQSLEDGGGTVRIKFNSTNTSYRDDGGSNILSGNSGTRTRLHAYSGQPIQIRDEEGGFTAVQYDTDATVGLLRTPNAGFRIEQNGKPSSGEGIEMFYNPAGPNGTIQANDRGAGAKRKLTLAGNPLELLGDGGLIDASAANADLRLASGQALEDGSGVNRVRLFSNGTQINDENGDGVFKADTGVARFDLAASPNIRLETGQAIEDGDGTRRFRFGASTTTIEAWSGVSPRIRDREGGFDAVKYITAASSPGTLEMTNAELDAKSNTIKGVNKIASNNSGLSINSDSDGWIVDGGHVRINAIGSDTAISPGSGAFYTSDGTTGITGDDGDVIVASEDSGGSGDKTAILFDYSAGSVSSERYKKNIRSLEADPYGILGVEAVTYTSRDGNEVTAHGFIAEELHEWSPHAVRTNELTEDWAHDEYVQKYGYEVGDEVPNQPRKWPVIAAHHEILRDLVSWAMENGYDPHGS